MPVKIHVPKKESDLQIVIRVLAEQLPPNHPDRKELQDRSKNRLSNKTQGGKRE